MSTWPAPPGTRLAVSGGCEKATPSMTIDPDVLRVDAIRYHSVYGSYGVSVFAASGATADEMAQQVPLVRFAALSLIKAGTMRGLTAAPPTWRVPTDLIAISGPATRTPRPGFGC